MSSFANRPTGPLNQNHVHYLSTHFADHVFFCICLSCSQYCTVAVIVVDDSYDDYDSDDAETTDDAPYIMLSRKTSDACMFCLF